jgi:hypothetical protein
MISFSEKLALLYLNPKKIESYRDRTIYQFIGIKFYKKYLPTTGDLVRKWQNKQQLNPRNSTLNTELLHIEKQTRKFEFRHLVGFLFFILMIFLIDKTLSVIDLVFLTFLNLYVNIYPIFLQRHNRIRILKVLIKNGAKSPYSK